MNITQTSSQIFLKWHVLPKEIQDYVLSYVHTIKNRKQLPTYCSCTGLYIVFMCAVVVLGIWCWLGYIAYVLVTTST